MSDHEDEKREPRTTLSDGTQVYPEHRNIIKEGARAGQQEGYVVLAEEERAKGFVRPVRRSYRHLKCNTVTTMGQTIAETYARNPYFYSGTFCCGCGLVEFDGKKPSIDFTTAGRAKGAKKPTPPAEVTE